MQNGAFSHLAASIKKELNKRGIKIIFWLAYSPDLNLIETVWNWMKDYIEQVYGNKEHFYDNL